MKILVSTYPTHPPLPGPQSLPAAPNCNWAFVQPQRTHGSNLGLGRLTGVELCVGSRFLELPILIGVAEIAHVRRTRHAHAPTCNNVGGYMKGESERTEEPKTPKSSGNRHSVHSVAAVAVMLPARPPRDPPKAAPTGGWLQGI